MSTKSSLAIKESKTNSTLETIMTRRSVRKYRAGPVPDGDLSVILEAGRQAPSAANRQPWSFVVVKNSPIKKKLATACNKQTWMAEAAVVLAAIGWPKASPKWYRLDVAIAMQNIILAAASLGYGTCWIGAFDEARVRQILRVPYYLEVIALTPIGVPASVPGARPRKDFNAVFSLDKFDQPLEIGF